MPRSFVLLVATAAGTIATAGSAAPPSPAQAAAPAKPRVALELTRTGYEYRWEYRILVRVQARAGAKPLTGLRVVARGTMDAPGHHMEAGPSRLRDRGNGVYASKVAFYMPGDWRIFVVITGAGVASSTTPFDVTLK